ncbi:diaminopimelate epimerase [Kocuria coralli]|uniref:Diaminopimelate epimerase n=1 Tax=Kocuria coralli TaxID=1461025 RepID=A0A5J5KWI9_9MICC|nr:diaminopimelate epimerase [Kocuria coralli]KAA9393630.1 diaminopimelate epimerase [Kocuria coralli]
MADGVFGELSGYPFLKAHGTGNDFVVVVDPEAELLLADDTVRLACDRHQGIGGDGFIRVARSEHLPEGREVLEQAPEAEWFMDYRNGDGSIAEMCGNGVRAFVHVLLRNGLVDLPPGQVVRVGTRAGVKTVARTDDGYAVDMGPWGFIDGDTARSRGSDAVVTAKGLRVPRPAVSITMGNPHTVVALAEGEKLDSLQLFTAPDVRPVPPDGTNVEFVVPLDEESGATEDVGRIRMRVHERGVGETQSCGTGACAAVAATRFWAGDTAPDEWLIEVPGGVVSATFVEGPHGAEHIVLAGPAVVVATGTFG